MRNFQDTFETRKRSFISAFSICTTVPLIMTKSLGSDKNYNHRKIRLRKGLDQQNY